MEKEHHHHHTTITAAVNKGENQAPVKSKGVAVSDNEDNNNKEQEKEDQAAVAYLHTLIVAINPRVRIFVTTFEGNMHEFGVSSLEQHIMPLCFILDDLQCHWLQPDVKAKRHYQFWRVAACLRKYIHNMIDEIYHKVALWLCENHRVIFLPTYETSNMVVKKRKGKKLTDKMQPSCKWQKIKANNKEEEEEEDKNAPEETKEYKSLYKKLKQTITSKMAHAMMTWANYLKHKLREFPG